eukprot:2803453-Pyramimonas_sp.AAC.1
MGPGRGGPGHAEPDGADSHFAVRARREPEAKGEESVEPGGGARAENRRPRQTSEPDDGGARAP